MSAEDEPFWIASEIAIEERGRSRDYLDVECRICRSTVYRPVPMVNRMEPPAVCRDPECIAQAARSRIRQLIRLDQIRQLTDAYRSYEEQVRLAQESVLRAFGVRFQS